MFLIRFYALGANVEVYIDNENNFKALFYQDKDMRDMFQCYPEILLVDATYKLNDLRLPLYVMLVVDGNGESEIVGLMLAADERQETIRQMMVYFKDLNPKWNEINCVMADKDMTERQVIKEELPQAGLLICLFHTMRTFRREVTTEKMGISNDERIQALEILQCMAYSKSESSYQVLYEQLLSTRLNTVIQYFNDNWHPIRNEWVEGFKNKYTNFLNSTNNRLESINQKLKAVVSSHSSLLEFNKQLQSCLSSLRVERDHRAASIFQKRPVCLNNLKEYELQYYNKCTPFAFKHIQKQLTLHEKCGKILENGLNGFFTIESKKGNLQVSSEKCHCDFFTSMKLPCRHILALRKHLSYPLYCESICDRRWTKDHYFMSHRIFKSCEQPLVGVEQVPEDSDGLSITVDTRKEKKILSQHDKYRKAFEVTRTLASLASEASGKLFQNRLATLHQILDSWKNGKEVILNSENDARSGNDDNAPIANHDDQPVLEKEAGEDTMVENNISNQEKKPQEENSSLGDKSHYKKTHSKDIESLILLLSISAGFLRFLSSSRNLQSSQVRFLIRKPVCELQTCEFRNSLEMNFSNLQRNCELHNDVRNVENLVEIDSKQFGNL